MKRIACVAAGFFLLLAPQTSVFSASAEVPIFDEAAIKADPQFSATTYAKLQNLQVDIAWDKIELVAALGELTDAAQKADHAHGRIEFRLAAAGADDSAGRRKVSVVLNGVPVFAVLEYLAQQTNFRIEVHENSVLVIPADFKSGQ
jgi:hypothetical protein